METGVTIVGLGNDIINANILGVSGNAPPPPCSVGLSAVQTAVLGNGNIPSLVTYQNGGFFGYFPDGTTAGSNTIFFTRNPGSENNFAVGDYVALFLYQAKDDGRTDLCSDTCPMQSDQVTAIDTVGHSITVQDPLYGSFGFQDGTANGGHPGPWIINTTCGKTPPPPPGHYSSGGPGPCTIHDNGIKNFTINTNLEPFNWQETWNTVSDSLIINMATCAICGGDVLNEFNIDTVLHWNWTNSTYTQQRNGLVFNEEAMQRESGYVLWQNITIGIPPGDTGGWTSWSYGETDFNCTWDHMTFNNAVPDPSGFVPYFIAMSGVNNAVTNSTINFQGVFNNAGSTPWVGIISPSTGNQGLHHFDGPYTITGNTINATVSNGGSIIGIWTCQDPGLPPLGTCGPTTINNNIINITPGGNVFPILMYTPISGFSIQGNQNVGQTGDGIYVKGAGSNCTIANNGTSGPFVTYIGGSNCTGKHAAPGDRATHSVLR
jgi:hypothetical protein